MRAGRWLSTYAAIARALELNPIADVLAAAVLALISIPRLARGSDLRRAIWGRTAVVAGAGPSLDDDLDRLIEAGWPGGAAVVAADDAVTALLERGVVPDAVVTDLDGDPGALMEAAARGSIPVVLAHGDNVASVIRVAPSLPKIAPSSQVIPMLVARVYGGFTDGDRAVRVAVEAGASRVVLVGMDMGREVGRRSAKGKEGRTGWLARKVAKLRIARALLEELAAEAGGSVELVDATGRGEGIEGFRREELPRPGARRGRGP